MTGQEAPSQNVQQFTIYLVQSHPEFSNHVCNRQARAPGDTGGTVYLIRAHSNEPLEEKAETLGRLQMGATTHHTSPSTDSIPNKAGSSVEMLRRIFLLIVFKYLDVVH